jgi:hypothetical protein
MHRLCRQIRSRAQVHFDNINSGGRTDVGGDLADRKYEQLHYGPDQDQAHEREHMSYTHQCLLFLPGPNKSTAIKPLIVDMMSSAPVRSWQAQATKLASPIAIAPIAAHDRSSDLVDRCCGCACILLATGRPVGIQNLPPHIMAT